MSELEQIAERFPIGADVLYFPLQGSFDFEATKIRSIPWALGHGDIIIKVEGRAGGVAIGHIRPSPTPPAPTVQEAKTAPVQGFANRIPWSLHLEAYSAYAAKYGTSQSADRIAERAGFGVPEMDEYVPDWRYRLSEIGLLRQAVVRYCDHSCTRTVEPPQLQQVIDDAFANTPSRATLSNGETGT